MNAIAISNATVEGRLDAVSLSLDAGKIVGLVGPNGSGKSSLLQFAAGLLSGKGDVAWNGRNISSIPILERGKLAAWVPQEAHFEFGFSVRSVVAQGRFSHADDGQEIETALEKFDLQKIADRPVDRLSGGERHRVLLARALATAAPLQLWDEPLASLDPKHALAALKIAHDLTRQAGATVVFSLHDLRLAHCLDSVVVMQERRIRAVGEPSAILTSELLMDVFGVRVLASSTFTIELP